MTTQNVTNTAQTYTYPVVNMGLRLREMTRVLSEFERKDIITRIWHKDHSVWKPSPNEISDRLGWLQIIDTMVDRVQELNAFADEIKKEGYRQVVLLGMGGSSLGPEVLRQTFGTAPNYPQLVVLDSTHPAWVEAVTRMIEPRHTLFLVSSKSGSTTETNALYGYFRGLVEQESGVAEAGKNFVAITDAQTSLGRLAQDSGFRRVFTNPSDIGGRYSILSYFGLLPAALIGLDLDRFLNRATRMQEGCANCVNIYQNPGAWLGALAGSFALHGRDKLTFVVSPSIRSFGLWIEQLIAESTGKEGKGIIPIIDEPQISPDHYADDRLFVYLRMKGDTNNRNDQFIERLETSGQPIINLEMDDQYDLGAEFFRWEFATAVAGAVLGINPFDQPDVESTKEATRQVLREIQSKSKGTQIQSCESLDKWLEQTRRDNYLAIMAYLKLTPALDKAFAKLRRKISEKYHIATTLGYGPRFLHSTGQLHKGGPGSGLFLQVTAGRRKDLMIPGKDYTLGELTAAEAAGDYRALETKGRRVTRLQLCSASGTAIEDIARDLE